MEQYLPFFLSADPLRYIGAFGEGMVCAVDLIIKRAGINTASVDSGSCREFGNKSAPGDLPPVKKAKDAEPPSQSVDSESDSDQEQRGKQK